ncbi:MAG: glycosyltransferase family 4 protein [Chitinophagales bacterium]
MKVLFISRATFFKDPGGDTIQAVETAKELGKLGVQADLKLCNEEIMYEEYDLIHFFNIIRPADILIHIEKSRKAFVISTIYVDYAEQEKQLRKGFAGLIFRTLSSNTIEYIKVVARWLVNGEKIISPSYLLLGQKKSIRRIVRQASMLLPNSRSEYERLKKDYRVENDYTIIPNGINPSIFIHQTEEQPRDPHLVICVGRIESRKNQINLIRALNNTKYQLILIGSPSANQAQYDEECRRLAAGNISFIHKLPQEELIAFYCKAKVHALPSWFETTGLSSLEAAAMGCNIVITEKGDTREYFGNYGFYCDPNSPASIFAAVENASSSLFNEQLRETIYSKNTWTRAAELTREVYHSVLGRIN